MTRNNGQIGDPVLVTRNYDDNYVKWQCYNISLKCRHINACACGMFSSVISQKKLTIEGVTFRNGMAQAVRKSFVQKLTTQYNNNNTESYRTVCNFRLLAGPLQR